LMLKPSVKNQTKCLTNKAIELLTFINFVK
jgi:hypothetical protein